MLQDIGPPPPFPVIKIVKYCGVGESGRGIRGAKKIMAPSLSVIKIVIVLWRLGGGGGAKILQMIMALPLSVMMIVILISIVGAWGAQKSYKNNGAPLSGITIVKYGGVWGEGGGAPKSYK